MAPYEGVSLEGVNGDRTWLENTIDRAIEEAQIRAKIDQDKKTRHACAEAVSQCKNFGVTNFIKDSEAHAACMNAKAI